jgi:type VI secretion system protein ImpE
MLRGEDVLAALPTAQEQVRNEPGKPEHRLALFQLLAAAGEWGGALKQLELASDLDPKLGLYAAAHRPLITCEALRAEVFAGRHAPLCLGEPPPWFAHLVEALRLDAEGAHGAAKMLRDQAFASAEARPGRLNEAPFAWLADADERLGPVLETVLDGRYFWVPFERVKRIEVAEPEHLRDLVWLPARFTWSNEGTAAGFIPVRYPRSESHDDDAIRLARRTEWQQMGEGSWKGVGQRMLATDQGEYALLDVRAIDLAARPTSAEARHA